MIGYPENIKRFQANQSCRELGLGGYGVAGGLLVGEGGPRGRNPRRRMRISPRQGHLQASGSPGDQLAGSSRCRPRRAAPGGGSGG